jgi:Putative auto-transporter adhesin, head GIN domain
MKADRAAGLLVLVAGAGLLSACGHDRDDRRAWGPSRSETREVGSFDSIDMSGAARLEITVGKPESLVLEGRASSIERVKTEIRHNTLYIESKPRDWFMSNNRRRITLKISVPRLESLEVEGGNDVRLTGFDGGEATIQAAGAAHILADGHLDELTVRMAGAGHGDFSRLVADETKVVVEGVGSVIVHPKDTLDATMNGVGAILYTGNPREVNTRMNGLGTIARRDPKDDAANEQETAPVDPDALQPEYDEPKKKIASDSTEVI